MYSCSRFLLVSMKQLSLGKLNLRIVNPSTKGEWRHIIRIEHYGSKESDCWKQKVHREDKRSDVTRYLKSSVFGHFSTSQSLQERGLGNTIAPSPSPPPI